MDKLDAQELKDMSLRIGDHMCVAYTIVSVAYACLFVHMHV